MSQVFENRKQYKTIRDMERHKLDKIDRKDVLLEG